MIGGLRSLMGAALLTSLLASAEAAADAVPPPPASCPPGTRGFTNHAVQGCGPAECVDDAACKTGEACAVYPLCVRRSVHESFRGNSYSAEVSGPCNQGKCPDGEACEDKPHCVPKGFISPGAPTRSPAPAGSAAPGATGPLPIAHPPSACGCSAPGGPGRLDVLGLAIAGAATMLVRRARRR